MPGVEIRQVLPKLENAARMLEGGIVANESVMRTSRAACGGNGEGPCHEELSDFHLARASSTSRCCRKSNSEEHDEKIGGL